MQKRTPQLKISSTGWVVRPGDKYYKIIAFSPEKVNKLFGVQPYEFFIDRVPAANKEEAKRKFSDNLQREHQILRCEEEVYE